MNWFSELRLHPGGEVHPVALLEIRASQPVKLCFVVVEDPAGAVVQCEIESMITTAGLSRRERASTLRCTVGADGAPCAGEVVELSAYWWPFAPSALIIATGPPWARPRRAGARSGSAGFGWTGEADDQRGVLALRGTEGHAHGALRPSCM